MLQSQWKATTSLLFKRIAIMIIVIGMSKWAMEIVINPPKGMRPALAPLMGTSLSHSVQPTIHHSTAASDGMFRIPIKCNLHSNHSHAWEINSSNEQGFWQYTDRTKLTTALLRSIKSCTWKVKVLYHSLSVFIVLYIYIACPIHPITRGFFPQTFLGQFSVKLKAVPGQQWLRMILERSETDSTIKDLIKQIKCHLFTQAWVVR